MGAGGSGGDAIGHASGPEGVFFGMGGRGESSGEFRDGRDGCDLIEKEGTVTMCGTGFGVENGRFTVVEVPDADPMTWEDLHVATSEQGFHLRVGDAMAPFDRPVELRPIERPPPGYDGTKLEATLAPLLEGEIRVGQAFSICGNSTATLWVWDSRPIGAMFGAYVGARACDGSLGLETGLRIAQEYDLSVGNAPEATGTEANCVAMPAGVATVDVRAVWDPQTPLAERLEVRLVGGPGDQAFIGASPLNAHLDAKGTDPAFVGLFVPEAGLARAQPVRLTIEFSFAGEPSALPGGPEPCQA